MPLSTQVDVIFWLDIALTFCTGIVRERECTVECVVLVSSVCAATPR